MASVKRSSRGTWAPVKETGTTPPGRILLPLALVAGLVAWATAILNQAFSYDEVRNAHAIWQISEGLVPFRDFFESQPPFLWYPFLPVLRLLPDGPAALFGLRFVAAGTTLLFVVALMAGLRVGRPELPLCWLVAAGSLVLFQQEVLEYSLRFRVDALAWATAFLAFARFELRSRSRVLRFGELGFLGLLVVIALPKLAVLVLTFGATDLARRFRAGEPVAPSIGGYAVGIGCGVWAALVFLLAAGIDPLHVWEFSVRYRAHMMSEAGFNSGVFEAVFAARFPLAVSLVGLSAWAGWLIRERQAPSALDVAVLATCVFQLAWVRVPEAEYVAPVFVLMALFFPYVGLWARSAGRDFERVGLASAAVLAIVAAVLSHASYRELGMAQRFLQVQRAIVELTEPDARIVVPPPFHPVNRHDAFYGLVHAFVPAGANTEEAMRQLDLPYRERRNTASYRRELEEQAPALVLFTGRSESFYSAEQSEAIGAYLVDHAGEYRTVVGVRPTLYMRVEPVTSQTAFARP